MWVFPLTRFNLESIPEKDHPGAFGSKRKFDTHTGVDLYCDENTSVLAVESGYVINIENFTGSKAESPWWNDTKAILIEGKSGVVLYGEIEPIVGLPIGDRVNGGQVIGKVKTVLKKDKGLPMTMLHFELYKYGTIQSEWWREEKPDNLLDPTEKLKQAFKNIL